MQNILFVAMGGALGATARHLASAMALRVLGNGWPWGTMTVNLFGSLLMGLLIGWLAFRVDGGTNWRLFLGTGVLGGFTTFSAFSFETVAMIEKKAYSNAAFYAFGSVFLGVLALAAGLLIARKVFAP
ncbi:MAG: fluoride efflux transporter CrcB [Hirschia sp.]|nr:fluoride efflux transporter CrcB [Hirschia sp.]MBF19889.1 fluoride efflux transporter CrcB [Hirschia sp.]